MTARKGSDGELLAAAAGSYAAIAETLGGVSASALRARDLGPSGSPELVASRVEALAACDPALLANVARSWPRPRDIKGDPWLAAAWTAGVRHLRPLGEVQRLEAEVPELADEALVAWSEAPNEPHPPVSFREISLLIREGLADERLVRRASAPALVEARLSREDLEAAPRLALRLLRGRAACLEPSALLVLSRWARDALRLEAREAALVLELCREASLPVVEDARETLARALFEGDDARRHRSLAFVLIGDWRVP